MSQKVNSVSEEGVGEAGTVRGGDVQTAKEESPEWPANTEVCKIYMYTYISIHTHNIYIFM